MGKKKLVNILIWVGLAILAVVVIVTSMILHAKKEKLNDLKEKNEIVKPEDSENMMENKIILKNFEIFIDNDEIF